MDAITVPYSSEDCNSPLPMEEAALRWEATRMLMNSGRFAPCDCLNLRAMMKVIQSPPIPSRDIEPSLIFANHTKPFFFFFIYFERGRERGIVCAHARMQAGDR